MSRSVLVADDEKIIVQSVTRILEQHDFHCIPAYDGEQAWSCYLEKKPDIIVLDIQMPGMDGLEFLKTLRAGDSATPVMFLTSRDEEIDRILGLELGADDYLGKPFSLRELLARVKVLARRLDRHNVSSEPPLMSHGPLRLDLHQYRATLNDMDLELTITEFRILASLIRIPGQVKTREMLMADAYPEDRYVDSRTIDSHIKRLRRKLAALWDGTDPIETVYGLGYAIGRGRAE